jgi:hypothetical protein
MAKKFEAAGLTTLSQAVKAFERRAFDRGEAARIAAWRKQLAERKEGA